MSEINTADANTLLVGDELMLKRNGKVCYGSIKRIVNQTPTKTFMVFESLIYENGKQEDNSYVIINNKDLYFMNDIKESAEVLDGTEPFSNGIFMINVPDKDILKRNDRVDKFTDELLAKAKNGVTSPVKIDSVEDVNETQLEETEAENPPDKKGRFKPVAIKKK